MDESRKFVRVYRAPPLINWGDDMARLVWMVLRQGLSTFYEKLYKCKPPPEE